MTRPAGTADEVMKQSQWQVHQFEGRIKDSNSVPHVFRRVQRAVYMVTVILHPTAKDMFMTQALNRSSVMVVNSGKQIQDTNSKNTCQIGISELPTLPLIEYGNGLSSVVAALMAGTISLPCAELV